MISLTMDVSTVVFVLVFSTILSLTGPKTLKVAKNPKIRTLTPELTSSDELFVEYGLVRKLFPVAWRTVKFVR